MENQTGEPTALEMAKQTLEKTDKDKFPKLYQARELTVKALEKANQQESRARLAEKKAKEKYEKKSAGEKTPKKQEKKEGFGYAQKAFLKVNDVLPDEYSLVEDIMKDTGKTLEEVLESKYFRAEQKELREAKQSADAIPDKSKRSSSTRKDEVSYWLAKGEMPPADQPALRREYVNAKLKKETDANKFTSRPVIK